VKIFYALAVTLAALMLSVSAAGAVYSLNADWRFMKAPKTIPLAQAKSSVETNGVKVEDPAFDDSTWEAVSVPHPINAHDSFDDRAVDAGEASFWRGMAFYRKRFALPGGTGNGEGVRHVRDGAAVGVPLGERKVRRILRGRDRAVRV
jgi:hypothetical protein